MLLIVQQDYNFWFWELFLLIESVSIPIEQTLGSVRIYFLFIEAYKQS